MSWPRRCLSRGGPRVVLGENLLQHRVVALDRGHGPVHGLADGRLPRPGLQVCPAGFLGHPENVLGDVLVAILGSLVSPPGQHGRVPLRERVRDVLEEDQAEHDVLVLGRIHRAPERIRHRPQFGLVSGHGAAIGLLVCHRPRCLLAPCRLGRTPEPDRSPRYDR